MTHPDGQVGFFNDSANGIAASFSQLDEYADRLGLKLPYSTDPQLVNLSDSGFVQVTQGPAFALLDVGEIGPDYLPGHAHADTLSFELSLFGQRCIVNSGISQYGDGAERHRVVQQAEQDHHARDAQKGLRHHSQGRLQRRRNYVQPSPEP